VDDLSYLDALERSPEPRVPVLGPLPCQRCDAWLEWMGAAYVNAGTDGVHQCAPFLEGQVAVELAELEATDPGFAREVVAVWSRETSAEWQAAWASGIERSWRPRPRPPTGLAPVRMAHEEQALPSWARWAGAGILWVTACVAAAWAVALVARELGL
jgi:hypothetical protein